MQTPKFLQVWSLKRIAFILIGGLTAISAFMASDWFFMGIGLIFALMGVFALGCVGKSCEVKPHNIDLDVLPEEDIEFDELK